MAWLPKTRWNGFRSNQEAATFEALHPPKSPIVFQGEKVKKKKKSVKKKKKSHIVFDLLPFLVSSL